MLQQWTRLYSQFTQRNYPPNVRAYIREYFADRFHISKLVEALPVLFFFWSRCICILQRYHRHIYYPCNIVRFCVLWYVILTLVAAHIS